MAPTNGYLYEEFINDLAPGRQAFSKRLAALQADDRLTVDYREKIMAAARRDFAALTIDQAKGALADMRASFETKRTELARLRAAFEANLDPARVADFVAEFESRLATVVDNPLAGTGRVTVISAWRQEAILMGDPNRSRALRRIARPILAEARRGTGTVASRAAELLETFVEDERAELGPEAPKLQAGMDAIQQLAGRMRSELMETERQLDAEAYLTRLRAGRPSAWEAELGFGGSMAATTGYAGAWLVTADRS